MKHVARRAATVALATVCACAAKRSFTSEPGMPCTEAARVAQGALLRLGFSPDVVALPKPGAPGKIVGRKHSEWSAATAESGSVYTVTVGITCSNLGAQFDAATDEPFPGALSFGTDFPAAIRTAAARRVTRPELKDRPEAGVVIGVEPLRGAEAAAEFGADLTAAGITPVRLKIDNRTDRRYAFAAAGVQLVSQEGERVEPLADDQAGALGAELQATMRRKRIADAAIAPRAVLSGFLYFPASAYRRATLVLIDQETEEEEGFSVEF